MERPLYKIVDSLDREAQIESRNNILNKSFVTDLWMKVITRAIEDIALYQIMRNNGKSLKEEDEDNEQSAIGFLFDDEHKIPMDDYKVDVQCPKCNGVWVGFLSTIAGQDSLCPLCNKLINKKYVQYSITKEQQIKEISLAELISLWGVEDVDGFRSGVRKRIKEIVKSKSK